MLTTIALGFHATHLVWIHDKDVAALPADGLSIANELVMDVVGAAWNHTSPDDSQVLAPLYPFVFMDMFLHLSIPTQNEPERRVESSYTTRRSESLSIDVWHRDKRRVGQ